MPVRAVTDAVEDHADHRALAPMLGEAARQVSVVVLYADLRQVAFIHRKPA